MAEKVEDKKSAQTTPKNSPETHSVPTSPPYPPYGYDMSDVSLAYVYPVSPQFSVQYYPDYASYPGSPSLSPSMNPTSPPFSPTFQYQQVALSPPTTAYMLPSHHHSAQPFPPLHLASPVLSTTPVPGSPPHQYLPGPYIISTADASRNNKRKQKQDHQQQQLQQQLEAEINSYHTHNIYVRGLPSSITDESFLEMCQEYGTVSSSKAIIDQKTGECKGYGFAMFEDEKNCEEAIEGLNKAGYQASYAKVGQESFSSRLRHLQDETSTNIYISNLPLDVNEEKLEELFLPYQTVSSRILRDPQSGISRGVGFARMSERNAATAIIERFNGHSIEGSSAPLQVRFADSPAQKKLKSQSAARRRVVRHQPLAGFSMRPLMPITPETMLGFAPAPSHPYYTEHPHIIHPQYAHHLHQSHHYVQPNTINNNDIAIKKNDEITDLTGELEQKMKLTS
ncbi:hypothetical protein G6F62_007790 [Rhizopus arrhizus]|nr:hypothetical protein G6F62_007790 [Rhizopus arrhizus]KAG1374585.1 hypothetical protein G6F61_009199 [Rhizopus arrhizus]